MTGRWTPRSTASRWRRDLGIAAAMAGVLVGGGYMVSGWMDFAGSGPKGGRLSVLLPVAATLAFAGGSWTLFRWRRRILPRALVHEAPPPAGFARRPTAERNPTAAWEGRHPRIVMVAFTLLLASAALAFIALRRRHPPFASPPGMEDVRPAVDAAWLATVLWALVAGLGALWTVEAGVRSRSIPNAGSAALRGLVVLAAAGACAAGYFLLLGLPSPRWQWPVTIDGILTAAGWSAALSLGIFEWWRRLARSAQGEEVRPPRK